MPGAEEHLSRVRRICLAFPGAEEKLSHGASTFFTPKKVFAMFADNVHGDGYLGVWLPASPGVQETLLATSPRAYFYPPYVGVKGWIGIQLEQVGDEELGERISEAWTLMTARKPRRR
ncbi:MAG: MmcQ/YjbR family DNA-binding protein [Bryobacteraceae bacterium]|nr:MmcQ/YjbR family DNA-binding protein [Bryobacteraceae bacterium]